MVIGGQAVIEGVLFVSPTHISLGVQTPKGIHTEVETRNRPAWLVFLTRIPFIRGMVSFFTMLIIGIKYLHKSSEFALDEKTNTSTPLLIVSGLVGIALGVLIFKFTPYGLASLLVDTPGPGFALVEGLVKLLLLLSYLSVIGLLPDVRRLFGYHAAEHMVINCVEAGKKLTVENVAKASRLHPRCGTSFVIFVILVSIAMYSFITLDSFIMRFVVRLLCLPLVAGIAYELLYASAHLAKYVPIVSWPGFGVQLLTTRKPNLGMIRVAIASYNALMTKRSA